MSAIVGLDLGQANDYTALVAVDRVTQRIPAPPLNNTWQFRNEHTGQLEHYRLRGGQAEKVEQIQAKDVFLYYAVRGIRQWPRGTPYPRIVEDVIDMMSGKLAGAPLVVDGTGVGRGIVDLFRRTNTNLIPVTITASGKPRRAEDGYWRVPKVDLISTAQLLLQEKQLQMRSDDPKVGTLVEELQNYQVKITAAANVIFNAREGEHDDLVLALCLACWWGEHTGSSLGIFF